MASLALGMVGGAIGNFFLPGIGGAIGYFIGSTIGGALFPTKTQGPRLTDLKLQNSEYGQMRPYCWGTVRIGGNLIWKTDLVEHKHGGGKGGGGPETFTYSASYALRLCGGPIIGIGRVWADSRLVYDGSQPYSQWPMTVYLGTETQLADPTMESVLGVGNVNANRGVAYIVMKDHDLSDFFNRIPNYTVEVIASGENRLERISTWAVPACPAYTGQPTFPVAGWYMRTGVLTRSKYTESTPTSTYQEFTYSRTTGNLLTTGPLIDVPNVNDASLVSYIPSLNSSVAFGLQRGAGSINVSRWYLAGARGTNNVRPPVGADEFYAVNAPPLSDGTFVYAAGNNAAQTLCFIGKWGYTIDGLEVSGTPEVEYFDLHPYGVLAGSNICLTMSDDGFLYAAHTLTTLTAELWKINPATMTLVQYWPLGPPGLSRCGGNSSFTVFRGGIVVPDVAGGGNAPANLYSIGASFTLLASVPATAFAPMVSLGGGYIITEDGILFIPAQEILANAVADLYELAGLDASQYDVAELIDDLDGLIVANQGPVRNALQPLQAGFFWDPIESDAKIKSPKRGRASSATITAADLGTRQEGAALIAQLAIKRAQEVELPKRVFVNFINEDADYQKGTQIAQRLVTSSQLEWTFDLPIVMTAQKALAVANTLLYMAWLQREQFSFSTPPMWMVSDPCDVNTVDGNVLRLTDRTITLDGVVKFDAVRSLAQLYQQTAVPAPAGGFTPQDPPTNQLSQLLMLDIPLIEDTDFPNGPYAAIAGAVSSSWRGANLNKSTDGGTNYVQQFPVTDAAIIGTASDALANFYGGNVFDELNFVTVIVGAGGGTLSSTNELATLNGANEWLLGYEIIRSKVCELTATDTYKLSGHIRGCRGTEWAMNTHVVGERFVALPVANVNDAFSEIGVAEKFKAVTFGQSLASTAAVDFTNTGAALRCYTPVHLGGGLDASGNATLTWTRRTRVGGAWLNGTDVALGETSEAYVVQIWDATYTICARIILASVASAAYSVADQITDFGAAQAHIYFTAGQLGAVGIGGQERGVIAGSGGSDNAPLTPIAPYVSSPSVPPPGPTNPVSVIMLWDGSNSPYRPAPHRIGETFVAQFTTDANPVGPGSINAAEYGNPAYLRYAVLSTDTGGTTILAQQYGNSVGFLFGAGAGQVNLSTFTTYYFIIRDQLPNGLPSGVIGDPANMVIEM